MTNELFEDLLTKEEGMMIDFKKEQYRFVKASDDEKSELLKDILGFANAWRRSKTYILIGVEEVRGGKSNVIGIDTSGPVGRSRSAAVCQQSRQHARALPVPSVHL